MVVLPAARRSPQDRATARAPASPPCGRAAPSGAEQMVLSQTTSFEADAGRSRSASGWGASAASPAASNSESLIPG